ncbi:hypothetical protein P7F60_05260 [Rhizobium sp. YJ-22]|uniref:hypothetical protein n=1 Tax=Rhizobium sp. YJ-22 TaxID=3037556 RepID=UPI00241261E9|nr:hypothetical protein [Rhizobium sp. YJ-22]MDG3575784.1 hypothetical protein [Rhizobium sp. YJ-22]
MQATDQALCRRVPFFIWAIFHRLGVTLRLSLQKSTACSRRMSTVWPKGGAPAHKIGGCRGRFWQFLPHFFLMIGLRYFYGSDARSIETNSILSAPNLHTKIFFVFLRKNENSPLIKTLITDR